eukprot:SAG22_NODE_375_length_11547_cov_12.885657_1_plen_423_part_10
MHKLRTSGRLSIADRAKIRLLVGDREHLARVMIRPTSQMTEPADTHAQGEQAAIRHRQLQDQDTDTLSVDSLAIAISVLVGTCGYVLQAWTSIKAQRHAADLQREHDQQVRDRQVEQDRTQAQIRRTERWVDDCCMPVNRALAEYGWSRNRFGEDCRTLCSLLVDTESTDDWRRQRAGTAVASKLEMIQPEAFAEVYKEYSMHGMDAKADGTIHALGKLFLDPNTIDLKGMTWGATTACSSMCAGISAAALDVQTQDTLAVIKYPFVRELPEAFFDLMAADLHGPLAEDYRGYIRHEVKPALDRIKDILHAHYAAIEAPPLEWLIETFPGHGRTDSPNNIADVTVGYARGWDRVLADWDAGRRLDVLYPPNHMMPWMALLKFNSWSRARGEAKQHELIGMSSGRSHKGGGGGGLDHGIAKELN